MKVPLNPNQLIAKMALSKPVRHSAQTISRHD